MGTGGSPNDKPELEKLKTSKFKFRLPLYPPDRESQLPQEDCGS